MKTTSNQPLADAAASFIAKNTAAKSGSKRAKSAASKKSKAAPKKATRKTAKTAAPKPRKPTAKKAAPKRAAKQTNRDPRLPAIGTKLTRTFKGEQIEVKVVDGGFEYLGGTFTSVSAVARHITGYAISGPVFFHLVESKRAKTEEK